MTADKADSIIIRTDCNLYKDLNFLNFILL